MRCVISSSVVDLEDRCGVFDDVVGFGGVVQPPCCAGETTEEVLQLGGGRGLTIRGEGEGVE
jgi:hypothetical protein